MGRSPPPEVTEFFPALDGVAVVERARDAYGRRSWVVGAARGENARKLEALFFRCVGRHKGFLFRVPDTGETIVARFDGDELPVVGAGTTTRTAAVVIREMFPA